MVFLFWFSFPLSWNTTAKNCFSIVDGKHYAVARVYEANMTSSAESWKQPQSKRKVLNSFTYYNQSILASHLIIRSRWTVSMKFSELHQGARGSVTPLSIIHPHTIEYRIWVYIHVSCKKRHKWFPVSVKLILTNGIARSDSEIRIFTWAFFLLQHVPGKCSCSLFPKN